MPKDYFPNHFYSDINPLLILKVLFDGCLTDSYPVFMGSKWNSRGGHQAESLYQTQAYAK